VLVKSLFNELIDMAKANPFDPKVSSVTVQYVTTASDARAFISAYGETAQTLTELSPKGVKVQAGGAAWPA
jgi:hypothetical protein